MGDIKIPDRLKQEKFRFVKIRKQDKRPFEKGWQKTTNYKYDDEVLLNWISQGNNYGVIGGFGDLIIIDSDHPFTQEQVKENLPETFQVKTRKGIHNYYICKGAEKIVLDNDENGEHYGEVQSHGSQCVGPSSIHPEGDIYTVINNIPIKEISLESLKFAIRKLYTKKEVIIPSKEMRQFGSRIDLDITQVCPTTGLRKIGNELVGPHPYHGSSNGNNFNINPGKNLWHCYRCDSGGDPMLWIAVENGIIDCSDAHRGALTGKAFHDTLKIAKEKYGLKIDPIMPKKVEIDNIDTIEQLRGKVLLTLSSKGGRAEATEMLALHIQKQNKIYTIRDDKVQEMWIYQNGIYVPQGISYIEEFCRIVLDTAYTSQIKNIVVAKVEADTYIDPDEFFPVNYKELICLNNGILNVKTRELTPHTPNKIFFAKLPVTYNSSATCNNIKYFFYEVLGNKEDVVVIQEVIGSCLYTDYFIEKAVMMIGNGRNGKTKTLDITKALIGPKNYSSLSLRQITEDKYMVADLLGKMANLAGDISSAEIKNIDVFKGLTGRDTVKSDRKYLKSIEFVSYAKQIFSCNTLPSPTEDTSAFWNRWVCIQFPYQFLPQKEIDMLKEDEKKYVKLQDPDIIEKITTPVEMSGLLNWALDGLDRLLKNKDFSKSETSKEVEKFWKRQISSIHAFAEDHIEKDFEGIIQPDVFARCYHHYCEEHNVAPDSAHKINEKMYEKFGIKRKKMMINGVQDRYWIGIKFKNGTKVGDFWVKELESFDQ